MIINFKQIELLFMYVVFIFIPGRGQYQRVLLQTDAENMNHNQASRNECSPIESYARPMMVTY